MSLSDIILSLTLLAIICYTWETKKLRIATQKQLEPILFLCVDQSEEHFELSNVGKSPISNVFIKPIFVGDYKFEFNILKPISHIVPEGKHRLEITRSKNLSRSFNINIGTLISAMQDIDIKKFTLSVEYDNNFGSHKEKGFIFEIPGRLPDEKDPIREYKIYTY